MGSFCGQLTSLWTKFIDDAKNCAHFFLLSTIRKKLMHNKSTINQIMMLSFNIVQSYYQKAQSKAQKSSCDQAPRSRGPPKDHRSQWIRVIESGQVEALWGDIYS